jgi:hypothetical protein
VVWFFLPFCRFWKRFHLIGNASLVVDLLTQKYAQLTDIKEKIVSPVATGLEPVGYH